MFKKSLLLPIMATLTVSLTPISVLANVAIIPAGVTAIPEIEVARFILSSCNLPCDGDLGQLKTKIKGLTHGQLVSVILATADRFLDPSTINPDRQIPWAGHLERLAFFFRTAQIPVDANVVARTTKLLENYRGIANLGEIASEKSHFNHDIINLFSESIPQIITATINLLPECDGNVCNHNIIVQTLAILQEYKGSTTITQVDQLLTKLESLLPEILKDPEINQKVQRIKELTHKEILDHRITKLCLLNKMWLRKIGAVK